MAESKSRLGRYALIAVAGLGILGTVFGAGFFVGRWQGRNERINVLPPLPRQSHGAIGKITQIEGNTLWLQKHDGTQQAVLIENRTRVERSTPAKVIKISARDLKVGDRVIVVGVPDERGSIRATVIRILAPPAPLLTPTPTGL
jgi:hypothetical protein